MKEITKRHNKDTGVTTLVNCLKLMMVSYEHPHLPSGVLVIVFVKKVNVLVDVCLARFT